ncbi:MAG TPA: RES family NAD+ phosphorylase [Candidatus Anammoximicrobium sp.]|nr:RES family NAD+ phosphorylase [Candidatus Anammoximicrobium sp.]
MTVTAWRIFKPKHAAAAFTGEGARLYGGRWNSKGTAVVYAAGSAALAALELLVHLAPQRMLELYQLCDVTFDEKIVKQVSHADLPANWRSDPAPQALKEIGDLWIASQTSAALRVPSAVIDTESNYLLNPAHPDFSRIQIGRARPFRLDPRLAK